jgi:hypothetical protein
MVDRASSRSVLGTGFPSSLRLTACYSFDGHNERVALKDQFNAQSAVSMVGHHPLSRAQRIRGRGVGIYSAA